MVAGLGVPIFRVFTVLAIKICASKYMQFDFFFQGQTPLDLAIHLKNAEQVKKLREIRLEKGLDRPHCLIRYTSDKVGSSVRALEKESDTVCILQIQWMFTA